MRQDPDVGGAILEIYSKEVMAIIGDIQLSSKVKPVQNSDI